MPGPRNMESEFGNSTKKLKSHMESLSLQDQKRRMVWKDKMNEAALQNGSLQLQWTVSGGRIQLNMPSLKSIPGASEFDDFDGSIGNMTFPYIDPIIYEYEKLFGQKGKEMVAERIQVAKRHRNSDGDGLGSGGGKRGRRADKYDKSAAIERSKEVKMAMEIAQASRLSAVRLVGIGLLEVPDQFCAKLHDLRVLALSNNELTELPENIHLLTNLQELNITYNKLTSLPDKIGMLPSLLKLGATNNRLARLPATFGALNMLERIDLECNDLRILPENLENLVSCRVFNVNNNKLVRLPRCLGKMPSLTQFSASCNDITYIPHEIAQSTTLEILRLNMNQITLIPERIGDMVQLKELCIDYNKIERIPISFRKLSNLRILRVEQGGGEGYTGKNTKILGSSSRAAGGKDDASSIVSALDDGQSTSRGHTANTVVGLKEPPPEIVAQGAQAVVRYCEEVFDSDELGRMRRIILSTQNVLKQVQRHRIANEAYFEPDVELPGFSHKDLWCAVDIAHLYNDLLPQLNRLWSQILKRRRRIENKAEKSNQLSRKKMAKSAFFGSSKPGVVAGTGQTTKKKLMFSETGSLVTAGSQQESIHSLESAQATDITYFPYTEKEVIWAFSNFYDAYGPVMKKTTTCFRKCACVERVPVLELPNQGENDSKKEEKEEEEEEVRGIERVDPETTVENPINHQSHTSNTIDHSQMSTYSSSARTAGPQIANLSRNSSSTFGRLSLLGRGVSFVGGGARNRRNQAPNQDQIRPEIRYKLRRKPCIPPKVGYMCSRVSVLFKMTIVRQRDKEERIWQAYKEKGVADAVKRAEVDAEEYLKSREGSLWLETIAYEQAEEAVDEQGANSAVERRLQKLEDRKRTIIRKFDTRKAKVQKARDAKVTKIQTELAKLKEDRKKAKEGYLKGAIDSRIHDLTIRMATLPETVQLNTLQAECEDECDMAEAAVYAGDDDLASVATSELDSSEYSSDDESEEAVRFRRMIDRRRHNRLEREKIETARKQLKYSTEEEFIKQENRKLAHPIVQNLRKISETVDARLIQPHILPAAHQIQKFAHKMKRKAGRRLRTYLEIAKMRVRKLALQANGNFDEIQREMKYEIAHQYVNYHVVVAREKARQEFESIDQVRQTFLGLSLERVFRSWRVWTLNKKQRVRRDFRHQWRNAAKAFDAAMESVRSAQLQVEQWEKKRDLYTDRPYWQHKKFKNEMVVDQLRREGSTLVNENNQYLMTFDRPSVRFYLPPNFSIPDPPMDLPIDEETGWPDFTVLETSSSESETDLIDRQEDERKIAKAARKEKILTFEKLRKKDRHKLRAQRERDEEDKEQQQQHMVIEGERSRKGENHVHRGDRFDEVGEGKTSKNEQNEQKSGRKSENGASSAVHPPNLNKSLSSSRSKEREHVRMRLRQKSVQFAFENSQNDARRFFYIDASDEEEEESSKGGSEQGSEEEEGSESSSGEGDSEESDDEESSTQPSHTLSHPHSLPPQRGQFFESHGMNLGQFHPNSAAVSTNHDKNNNKINKKSGAPHKIFQTVYQQRAFEHQQKMAENGENMTKLEEEAKAITTRDILELSQFAEELREEQRKGVQDQWRDFAQQDPEAYAAYRENVLERSQQMPNLLGTTGKSTEIVALPPPDVSKPLYAYYNREVAKEISSIQFGNGYTPGSGLVQSLRFMRQQQRQAQQEKAMREENEREEKEQGKESKERESAQNEREGNGKYTMEYANDLSQKAQNHSLYTPYPRFGQEGQGMPYHPLVTIPERGGGENEREKEEVQLGEGQGGGEGSLETINQDEYTSFGLQNDGTFDQEQQHPSRPVSSSSRGSQRLNSAEFGQKSDGNFQAENQSLVPFVANYDGNIANSGGIGCGEENYNAVVLYEGGYTCEEGAVSYEPEQQTQEQQQLQEYDYSSYYDEYGGYYDEHGNYIQPDNNYAIIPAASTTDAAAAVGEGGEVAYYSANDGDYFQYNGDNSGREYQVTQYAANAADEGAVESYKYAGYDENGYPVSSGENVGYTQAPHEQQGQQQEEWGMVAYETGQETGFSSDFLQQTPVVTGREQGVAISGSNLPKFESKEDEDDEEWRLNYGVPLSEKLKYESIMNEKYAKKWLSDSGARDTEKGGSLSGIMSGFEGFGLDGGAGSLEYSSAFAPTVRSGASLSLEGQIARAMEYMASSVQYKARMQLYEGGMMSSLFESKADAKSNAKKDTSSRRKSADITAGIGFSGVGGKYVKNMSQSNDFGGFGADSFDASTKSVRFSGKLPATGRQEEEMTPELQRELWLQQQQRQKEKDEEKTREKASLESEAAYFVIRKRRAQLNPTKHKLYMHQLNRKARSFEQIKADQKRAQFEKLEELKKNDDLAALLEMQRQVMAQFPDDFRDQKAVGDAMNESGVTRQEQLLLDIMSRSTAKANQGGKSAAQTKHFLDLTDEDLLILAGGDLDMLSVGKDAIELRSVLAQRAIMIKAKLKQRAIETGQIKRPPKQTFFQREIRPLFGTYHGSSSDEEENENYQAGKGKNSRRALEDKLAREKEARRAKRRELREAKDMVKEKVIGVQSVKREKSERDMTEKIGF